ncbi:5-deoxy-glucuronate isomerase [Thermoactinomyces sp. CICC 10522]|uniref:5-deoxy-glucuronate isomerase n=1 Tax=Thermoactinomyces sp. CICC 10522 TaxID=2767427 RepID=UPI0018DC1578|nr:5-deoxy-glucuronate isomerase [Thermoactinomyces sp. CICC 10522]MBH8602825.1 5-deoxy-glucuronate isomerase [Thermoactinomyces sp. CICC 10522]
MKLLYHVEEKSGYQSVIDESCDVLEYNRFDFLRLGRGETWRGETGDYETVLVILGGKATFTVEGLTWEQVGRRENVFSGKATALYVPIRTAFSVTEAGGGTLQIGVCKVKAEQKFQPFLVEPEEIVVHHRGKETWKREVHDIIADNGEGRVQRIVLGETYGEPGGWSSYPPHKHDENSETEVKMEEIYYFQMEPQQGFGVQLVYTEDGEVNESFIIRHGDAVALHKGYHPVAAAGGYKIYYLWFLGGGDGRRLKPFDQPAHKWLLQD